MANTLQNLCDNSRVLYYPIVSMRDYKTNQYDLSCDGNVNRFISFFYQTKAKVIRILLPEVKRIKPSSLEFLNKHIQNIRSVTDQDIEIIHGKFFRINALLTRKSAHKNGSIIRDIMCANDIDTVIYEPNSFHKCIGRLNLCPNLKNKKINFIYWCPVSDTKDVKPTFLKDFANDDIKCIDSSMHVVFASPKQKQYFLELFKPLISQEGYEALNNKIEVRTKIIEPKYFTGTFIAEQIKQKLGTTKNFVYLPFRLSDAGYNIEFILKTVASLRQAGVDVKVIYSDPNSSEAFVSSDLYKDFCFKVGQHGRDDYYAILKAFNKHNKCGYNMVIPYLENSDDIIHASVFEFEFFEDNFIKFKTAYQYKGETIINGMEELYQTLSTFFN